MRPIYIAYSGHSHLFFTSATDGIDYETTALPVVFTPENSSVPFCVIIFAFSDESVEDSEVFTVSIESIDPAVQISQTTSTVLIMDMPPGT